MRPAFQDRMVIIRRPGCGPVVLLASITMTAVAVMDAKGAGAWPWLEWFREYEPEHMYSDLGSYGVFARPKVRREPYELIWNMTAQYAVDLLPFWGEAAANYSRGTDEMQAISAAVMSRLVALRDLDMSKGAALWR